VLYRGFGYEFCSPIIFFIFKPLPLSPFFLRRLSSLIMDDENGAEHAVASAGLRASFQDLTKSMVDYDRHDIVRETNNWISSFPTKEEQFVAVVECFDHADKHVEVAEEVVGKPGHC